MQLQVALLYLNVLFPKLRYNKSFQTLILQSLPPQHSPSNPPNEERQTSVKKVYFTVNNLKKINFLLSVVEATY